MIAAVVKLALGRALKELPFGALGVRCHALPVDEDLKGCLEGIGALLSDPDFENTRCVVGSALGSFVPPPRTEVLESDLAAAEATRIRNDPDLAGKPGFRLIYLNSGSTPGEAGLEDVLVEVRAQSLARYYAEGGGLLLLAEVGRCRSRQIVERLEDTTIATLARYATTAGVRGELVALPTLGFLPRSLRQDRERPTAQWVNEFDALTSGRLVEPLAKGIKALRALGPDQRERFAAALRQADGLLTSDLAASVDFLARLIELAGAAQSFALGQQQDPSGLCGLNGRLLNVLKSAQRIEALAADDDGGDDDSDESGGDSDPPQSLVLPEEQILATEGPDRLRGKIDRFEVEDATLEVALKRCDDDVIMIAPSEPHIATWMTVQDVPVLQAEGTCVAVALEAAMDGSPEAAILGSVKAVELRVRYRLENINQTQPDLRQAIDRFLASRQSFIAAIGALLPDEEEPRFSRDQRTLLALDTIPLTCLANAEGSAAAYVAAYVDLMAHAYQVPIRPPYEIEKWLTHLDMAVALDPNQGTVAARLQPLHPLRIARALLWLEKRAEPPLFPSFIVTNTGYSPDSLFPHGEPYCYHTRPGCGPSREGVEAAVKDGLAAIWSLLAPHGLMTALDVELIDVVSTGAAIEALYSAAVDRFAADATVGAGVHLRVRCAYSEARTSRGIVCPSVADLPELAAVAGAIPGNGVTLEIMPQPIAEGCEEVHLAVHAVEAAYHGMQPSANVGWGAKYIAGQSGNIIAVEFTGNAALDGYRRLLAAYQRDITATFDPGLERRQPGKWLVKTYVAVGGWPVRPDADDSLLSYNAVGPDVVVTLADGKVFDGEVSRRLKDFSVGGADAVGDLQSLREGMLGLFPCRSFLADLLGGGDERHILGWLGILRAYGQTQRSLGNDATLALSLDGPEGRAWVHAMASIFGTDKGRADLLVLEADLETGTVKRIRAVELKARTSTKHLTSRNARAKLARQALVTAARLRAVLSPAQARSEELRDSLRRLLWLGAGQQRAALRWKETLDNFDATLLGDGAVAVPVTAECWLVPEEPWDGAADVEEQMLTLDVNGTPIADSFESVRVRVLQAVSINETEGEHSAASAPSRSAAPRPEVEQGGHSPSPPAQTAGIEAPASLLNPQSPASGVGETPAAFGPRRTTAPSKPNPPPTELPEQAVPPVPPASASNASRAPSQRAASLDGIEVVFGRVLQGTTGEATWLPNRSDLVTHFNVGITGTMGSGKTQFTKSILTQIYRRGGDNPGGRRPGMLIFDYKGDYVDVAPGGFAHAVGARVLKPHWLPMNPLRLNQPTSTLDLKLAIRQFAETIRTIAKATGDVQRLGIIQAIEGCLRDSGVDSADPSTWTKPFPTLKDLHARLVTTNEVEGAPFAVIHDLADFEIFAPNDPGAELAALFDAVTVIDLRPLAGAEKVIRAVISFFMNAMFAGMIQHGESIRADRALPSGGRADMREVRRLLLVDEADDFIGLDLPSLKNVMQQGRAFGYGVILSTQFLHHFDRPNSPLKPLIGTWVLHRMGDVAPTALRNLFGLSNDDARALANTLNGLDVHTSMCFGLSNPGCQRQLTRIRDLPFFELPPS